MTELTLHGSLVKVGQSDDPTETPVYTKPVQDAAVIKDNYRRANTAPALITEYVKDGITYRVFKDDILRRDRDGNPLFDRPEPGLGSDRGKGFIPMKELQAERAEASEKAEADAKAARDAEAERLAIERNNPVRGSNGRFVSRRDASLS